MLKMAGSGLCDDEHIACKSLNRMQPSCIPLPPPIEGTQRVVSIPELFTRPVLVLPL